MQADPTPSRPPAFLFMGDLVIVARQARLISEARRRGLAPLLVVTPHTRPERLAACQGDPRHPLSALAEVVSVPDATTDHVLPGIQPLLQRYDVRGVICIGDFFVEPAGITAHCLGLPGPGAGASRMARNKVLQRTALPDLSPAWQVVTPEQRDTFDPGPVTFPVVVKPAGRFSSLGVHRVDDGDRLKSVLREYEPGELVLIEQLVEGPEFSVESLVQRGEILWQGVTAKRTNERLGSSFTEMGHTSPAVLSDADEKLLHQANAEVLGRIGFADGISHVEFRLSAGVPVLMEAATRLPGGAITFLWELATGEPLEPVMVDLALGRAVRYPLPRRRATQAYFDHPTGRLRDVVSTGPEVHWVERDDRWPVPRPVPADAPAGARSVLVTQQPHALLGPQIDGEQRSGSILFDAPLDEPHEALADRFLAEVTVVVDTDGIGRDGSSS
ncbi:ATP-grasp domain-containing protein [Streptomyces sp. NPDC048109]|uniref:ATP-grasp domain-containing protein n=1 Tax=Streptomyces sp. NPDC048109 TaxID=3155482 RepID=UPI00342A1E63